MFIGNKFDSKLILVFDWEGKYLYKIDDFGEEPDKYSILMGFTLSHDGKEALILDSNRSKIMHYDVTNGALLKTTSLDFPRQMIARIPYGGYVFKTNEPLQLVITNGDFQKQYKALDPIPKGLSLLIS